YEIVLQKPGYRIKQATLQQDEFSWPRGIAAVACGACTFGLGCFGLLWSWQLKDRYAFTLEPAAAETPPASSPSSTPADGSQTAPDAASPGPSDPGAKIPL
ncbi:MAG: hypothetical protein JXR83_09200, partial [Deltaproteobacteria bacterium]|nr:hypothetical protein [Deltaproteobacteria bacterium]